jgi:hypothetical protein
MPRTRPFFRPLDAAVLLLVAAAAAWAFLAFRFPDAGKAVVFVGDARYGWYDLEGPVRRVEVPTRIGPVTLEIGGGAARVARSPCPNRLCVRQGTVRRAHSELICMPARLLVVLEGGAKEDDREPRIDAVTY